MDLEHEAKIARIEKETKSFSCPCCGERLKFGVTLNVNGVRKESEWTAGDTILPPTVSKSALTDDEMAIIARHKASGAFDAFVKAVNLLPGPKPSHLERAFLNLPTVLTKYQKAPQVALIMCLPKNETRGARLELWKCGYVEIIVRDGEIITFLPVGAVMDGKTRDMMTLNGKQEGVSLDYWVKTRFGYVAGKGLMLGELRQKGAGSFALADRP